MMRYKVCDMLYRWTTWMDKSLPVLMFFFLLFMIVLADDDDDDNLTRIQPAKGAHCCLMMITPCIHRADVRQKFDIYLGTKGHMVPRDNCPYSTRMPPDMNMNTESIAQATSIEFQSKSHNIKTQQSSRTFAFQTPDVRTIVASSHARCTGARLPAHRVIVADRSLFRVGSHTISGVR
ncbi:hypothetical protein CBL_03085 [Carabus blaptoides fortunei]